MIPLWMIVFGLITLTVLAAVLAIALGNKREGGS